MKLLSLLLVQLTLLTAACAQNLSKKQWLEDVVFLEKALYEKHVNPFWKNQKTAFDARFAEVRNYITNTAEETLVPQKITTAFAQILALTGDGHSGVSTKSRAELFGLYNYNVSWFPEGLFLTRTEESKKEFLGSRILKMDDTPVEGVKKLVQSVSTSFHDWGFKRFSPRYLESPGVLHGLGIAKSPQTVILTVEKLDGRVTTLQFEKVGLKEQEKTKFLTLNQTANYTLPLYRQPRNQNYWAEYVPQHKLLYLNYALAQNSKEEPMEAFVKKLAQQMETSEVEKFVIDLRFNGGGDQFTTWPLLGYLMNHPKINHPGKLFVITGHGTFSAATALAMALDAITHSITVGAPMSDSPIYPAEDNNVVLPHCKMEARLSSELWNYSIDGDERNIIEPELLVVTSFRDYIQGKDPVLEAIMNYKATPAVAPILNPEKYTGRYLLGTDKTLEVVNNKGVLSARAKGRLNTLLTSTGGDRFTTGIKGLTFEFVNNELVMHFEGAKSKTLKRIDERTVTALDLVLQEKYDEASKAYRALHQKNPENININGTTLAGLAYYYLLDTNDIDGAIAIATIATELDKRSEVAKNLLKGLKAFKKQ